MTIEIFYHDNCRDGIACAFVAQEALLARHPLATLTFRPYNFRPMTLSSPQPDHVYCLDCVVPEVAGYTCPITIIDHHIGNEDKILEVGRKAKGNVKIVFDLRHSAARLTWIHFHTDAYTPWPILYIEDRDIWTWKLPQSRAVNAGISTFPYTIEGMRELMKSSLDEVGRMGKAILSLKRGEMAKALETRHLVILPDNQEFLAINSQNNQSELGNILAQMAGRETTSQRLIGVVYYFTGSDIKLSFRSIGEESVATIAANYGGGGHKNAAGATVIYEHFEVTDLNGKSRFTQEEINALLDAGLE